MDISNKTVAIVGLGMLGGSLAARLVQEKACGAVIGYARRQETVDYALAHAVVDQASTDLEAVLKAADVAIFCTPIPVTIRLVNEYRDQFKPGAVISDIGSTKGGLVKACEEALAGSNACFVGGHPMAGSEKFGLEYFKMDMYNNATIFLTPDDNATDEAIETLKAVWSAVRGVPYILDATKHDEVVGYASQALHVMATAATIAVLDNEDGRLCSAASAGGFRDSTRIASSNPVMWREIIENNPLGNLVALDHIIDELQSARDLIAKGDWDGVETFFRQGKELRDAWLNVRFNQE